jgi:hypothetical protein
MYFKIKKLHERIFEQPNSSDSTNIYSNVISPTSKRTTKIEEILTKSSTTHFLTEKILCKPIPNEICPWHRDKIQYSPEGANEEIQFPLID